MRRIVMRVGTENLVKAYDVLLPRLRGGVHPADLGEETVLTALGEEGELPPAAELETALGDLLCGMAVESDAGPDLASALARTIPPWKIVGVRGLVIIRTDMHKLPPDGWVDVVLPRGAGFGTGAHPTTRHCIELMLDLESWGTFADLGCGAGALTITAAKLGYAPVIGVDLTDEVTDSALSNATANGVDCDFFTADLLGMDRLDARVAVVNVSDLSVHHHIADVPMAELEALIVSGLNKPPELAAAVARYLAASELGLQEVRRIDALGWPAVLLVRRP